MDATTTLDLTLNFADLPGGVLSLAHFGCTVLGNLKEPIPDSIREEWDRKLGSRKVWNSKQKATERLATTLRKAAMEAGFSALTLWDTMRNGSDYWRPGKLLSDVANRLASPEPSIAVTLLKLDELCPPTDLLSEFRDDQVMAFGEYAHRYAEYLQNTPRLLERVAARVVIELRVGSLPAFFCIDPYIPDYVSPAQLLRTPYRERSWMKELRSSGCHRVILVEELVGFYIRRGLGRATVFEIDPTFARVFRREIFR